MLISSNNRYTLLFPLLLFTIWLWVLLDRPYTLPTHFAWNIYSNTPLTPPITDLFHAPALSSVSLRHLCATTLFPPRNPRPISPIFVCEENYGSAIEVRNSILHCVRFAIAAGAGGLVVPKVVARDSRDGDPITRDERELEYLFDRDAFLAGLARSCPALRVYENERRIPNVGSALGPVKLSKPWEIVSLGEGVEVWGERFYKWLEKEVGRMNVVIGEDDEKTVIVELGRSYLQWPIYNDGSEIAETFGGLLVFSKEIRELATTVLLEMAEKYHMSQDLESPIVRRAFLGAVFNTKHEELPDGVVIQDSTSSYESQSQIYFTQAQHTNLSLIYATSDEATNLDQFMQEGRERGFNITCTVDLLLAEDKTKLLSWSVDQQEAVDFLVIEKASQIAGVGHSDFAWNSALRRHRLASVKRHLEGPLMMNDEFSLIYGEVGGNPQFAACMWP